MRRKLGQPQYILCNCLWSFTILQKTSNYEELHDPRTSFIHLLERKRFCNVRWLEEKKDRVTIRDMFYHSPGVIVDYSTTFVNSKSQPAYQSGLKLQKWRERTVYLFFFSSVSFVQTREKKINLTERILLGEKELRIRLTCIRVNEISTNWGHWDF